ncbi:membrane protein insertase YidC [Aestuariibius sp. 2305UL40-4]|uniref:membrane protein insertase YidC n=1 Tax=Aestuariibius violaceus TaxID=3234132 RepID=UPI00345E988A
MDDQNKNFILATALSFLVLLAWLIFFPPPEAPQQPTDAALPPSTVEPGAADVVVPPTAAPAEATGTVAPSSDIAQALENAPRVTIDSGSLTGSISLLGGRIDELYLKDYRETLDPEAPIVQLLSPVGSAEPYYALHGWAAQAGVAADDVPNARTIWQIEAGETLAPQDPVTLVWQNGNGLTFRKTFSMDDKFLFTIEQSVENTSGTDVSLAPYGIVARHGEPDDLTGFFIIHEGAIRMTDGELEETSYSNMTELDADPRGRGLVDSVQVTENGWIGFTDHYWMTTLIPPSGESFRSIARYSPSRDLYQTEVVMPVRTVAAGETLTQQTQLFAGAKEWEAIQTYQNEGGINRFIDSIDWGWFFFLTKPIFWLLHELNLIIGNMGWAIIVLTLIIKAVLLPLAYKSYVSMAKMKELQPEMEKLKEKAGDDRQQLQQGMMELYKKNKVNPASGCLPILLQIPIFFSLYKVIFVTIELRHAEWLGWIRDLSAPDPSSILNLFGLLPWSTPEPGSLFFIFSLGILPIFLGISMWLQQKLNPAPTDPTQKMIFAWMPWVFMFMLGSFASGLVLYWIANNVITFAQQYLIMRSQGMKPDLFGNITEGFRKKDTKDQ